jgi:formiminotetrahydrofolate cyclodeaminase
MQQQLISLPANQLLDKFGAGSHKPGSGSAAALMGILAAKLTLTVCKLTLEKIEYQRHRRSLEYIVDQVVNKIEPALQNHFERDAEIFDLVIRARRARDNADTLEEKKRFRKEELIYLREATEIPIDIGRLCLSLIDHGIHIFDNGFQSARGDSGASVSVAIAGVTSGVFVAHINLKSFGSSTWKDSKEKDCEQLLKDLEQKQMEALSRIATLSVEEPRTMDLDLETN